MHYIVGSYWHLDKVSFNLGERPDSIPEYQVSGCAKAVSSPQQREVGWQLGLRGYMVHFIGW
jgi:hypothetical protein